MFLFHTALNKWPWPQKKKKKKIATSVLQRSKTLDGSKNINYIYSEVKVYNSIFQCLDRTSPQCVKGLLQQGDAVPLVKMLQCCKQAGTKDCGVYAISFASAIAFGKHSTGQNLKKGTTSLCC